MDEVQLALQVAQEAFKTAKDQLPVLQVHKERCTLLHKRCEVLLQLHEVQELATRGNPDKNNLINGKVETLRSTLITIRDTIVEQASKGLAWRLLHQDHMERCLTAAEAKLADAFFEFHIGTQNAAGDIHDDIVQASRADQQELITYLERIAQSDQMIIEALRSDNLRLEETMIALMKHVQTRPTNIHENQPSERFIRRAVSALQGVSSGSARHVLPWQITSLEVEYERTEENCLGAGGFGKVFKGEWHGELVAVKEMHKNSDGRNEPYRKAFRKEIDVWLRITHPRILPFYGACLESATPFLVTQYCQYGNVMDFIQVFPDTDRLLITYDVSVGMRYLHSQSVIHADLKAANILIGDDAKALICDFGLSHLKHQVISSGSSSGSSSSSWSIHGTLNYMAPEYLEQGTIDYPMDVYSFAMTTWQIYTGLFPLADIRIDLKDRIVTDQERPEYPDSMSLELWDLIEKCWRHNPDERPTFLDVEAFLKPYGKARKCPSLSASEMLLAPPLPSPPSSIIYELRQPSSSNHVTNGGGTDGVFSQNLPSPPVDQVSLPPTSPLHRPISPNSRNVYRRTLKTLGEPHDLDDYIVETLGCYENWVKNKVINSRGPRGNPYVLRNRVKISVKSFKTASLFWIDRITELEGVEAYNELRVLLFITATCAMAEHAHRQNPNEPHLCVQPFVNNSINKNRFRSDVEQFVEAAWTQYWKDRTLLGNELVMAVHKLLSS